MNLKRDRIYIRFMIALLILGLILGVASVLEPITIVPY